MPHHNDWQREIRATEQTRAQMNCQNNEVGLAPCNAYDGDMHVRPISSIDFMGFAISAFSLVTALAFSGATGTPAWAASQRPQEPAIFELRTDELKFLDGLRQRQLFELAQTYVDRQLQIDSLPAALQAAWTVEQIKTLTAQAAFLPHASRSPVWKSIDSLAAPFAKSSAEPKAVLVIVQQALARLTEAKLLNQELAAEMVASSLRDRGLSNLREARNLLEEAQRSINNQIPIRAARSPESGELSSDQLMALRTNIGYQMARCNLVRSQLYQYPADTGPQPTQADRVDAMNQALQQLRDVRANVPLEDPLWWNARLAEIEALRLAGQIEATNPIFAELTSREIPEHIQKALAEEKLRLAMLGRDRVSLKQILGTLSDIREPSPTLDLTILDANLFLAASAETAPEKNRWITVASELTRKMEQQYGGYWGRRAELALIDSVGNPLAAGPSNPPDPRNNPANNPPANSMANGSAAFDVLVRAASEAQRKGRWDDAIKGFDRAIKMAIDQGNANLVQQLQVRSGQIFESAGNHRQAAARMLEAAATERGSPLASSAHLRGCWNLAKVMRVQNEPEKRQRLMTDLEASLKQHLQWFANQKTAPQAAAWLANQYLETEKQREAIQVLLQVPRVGSESLAALDKARNLYALWLNSGDPQSKNEKASFLREQLQRRLSQLSEPSDFQRKLILLSAELDTLIDGAPVNPAIADQIRSANLQQVDALQSDAQILLLGEAIRSDASAASALAKDIPEGQRERSYALLSALAKSKKIDTAQQTNALDMLATLVNQSLHEIDASKSNADVSQWRFRQAEILIAQQDLEAAIEVLEALSQSFPNKAITKVKLAEALTLRAESASPEQKASAMQAAVDQWRIIAARTRPHTGTWYQAKYEVARLLKLSGKSDQAKKLLQYLKAIPPGWDKSSLKSSFEALLRTLEN